MMKWHIWGLRPPTVVFALFSDSVEDAVEQKMAGKLAALPVPEAFLHGNVTVDEKPRLPDLVDETSWLVFSRLAVASCVALSAAEWGEDPANREGKRVVEGLKVTNVVT